MRKLFLLLSLIIILALPQFALAELPTCPAGTKPERLTISLYFVEDNGKVINPVPTFIPVGMRVHFDATPKNDSQGCQTTGSGNIQWIINPTGLLGPQGGGNPFVPAYVVQKEGSIAVQATLDGVNSNTVTLSFGNAGTNPSSAGAGSVAEVYAYCAYKKAGKNICINSSSTDVSCTSTPECKTNGGCTRVLLDKCSNGGADFCKDAALPNPPAQDLGQLISQLFTWSLSILGICIFIVMLYSGTQWILAAGNPSSINAAKKRMQDAAIAAVFLLSSYVILKALNPDFVSQKSPFPEFKSTATTTSPFVKSCSTVAPAPTTAK